MSEFRKKWGRFFIATGFSVALFLGLAPKLSSQELPLRRDIPGTDPPTCPAIELNAQPTEEEVAQANQLGSDAGIQNSLGDQARARDLFQRATELDPTSADLAYDFARILEDLGERDAAKEQYCRALGLSPGGEVFRDARPRLDAIAMADAPQLPEAARSQFLNGLLQADLGNLAGALEAFDAAFQAAPDWGDAVYNRGIIRIRLGEQDLAVEDLQRYLALEPDAEDAIEVSQRMGQLQIQPSSPVSPGTALGLGLVLPGGGQFYSGRALPGLGVLALAGGAAAAGFLIEETEVRCVGSVSSGSCPPERVISESTNKPYKMYGLAAAGAMAVIGAIEAYLKARGGSGGVEDEGLGVDVGSARLIVPSVSSAGSRLHFNLLRVTF